MWGVLGWRGDFSLARSCGVGAVLGVCGECKKGRENAGEEQTKIVGCVRVEGRAFVPCILK